MFSIVCDTVVKEWGGVRGFSRISKMGRVILKFYRRLNVVSQDLNLRLLAFLPLIFHFGLEQYS